VRSLTRVRLADADALSGDSKYGMPRLLWLDHLLWEHDFYWSMIFPQNRFAAFRIMPKNRHYRDLTRTPLSRAVSRDRSGK
jgi:hypothetical protein